MKPILLIATACAIGAATFANAADRPNWSYSGPTGVGHWADLDDTFRTCRLGKTQSPIDIITKQTQVAGHRESIAFDYTPGASEVINNGHTIQLDLPSGGAISVDGNEYTLLQIHFHPPSEEKIDGKSFPLVAHLVHRDARGGLAVVAVLFKLGKENSALKPVFAHLPTGAGEAYRLDADFDAEQLLPATRGYYAFAGSLTTPPCSEEVRWNVLKTPVELSSAQLAAFRKLYPLNARPVQALNNREVIDVDH